METWDRFPKYNIKEEIMKATLSIVTILAIVAGAVAYNKQKTIEKQQKLISGFAEQQEIAIEIFETFKGMNFGSDSKNTITVAPGITTEEIAINASKFNSKGLRDVLYTGTPDNIKTIRYYMGIIESEFNYTVVNKWGYAGAYQYSKITWNEAVNYCVRKGYLSKRVPYTKRNHKFIVDADTQDTVMYGRIEQLAKQLKNKGVKPSLYTIYGAHQQGLSGFVIAYKFAKGIKQNLTTKQKIRLVGNYLNNLPNGVRYVANTWNRGYATYISGIITATENNGGKFPKGKLKEVHKESFSKVMR